MSIVVGLLLPKSVLYPSMGFDILGGLRYSLQDLGVKDIQIRTESIALGTDDKQIYAACEKMLFDGVKIVCGYVNPRSAEKLEPLLAAANAVFIALDAGYHFPSSTNKYEHIFYLSLQGALCIRISVTSAVVAGDKRIGYTSSFYDAGYRSALAAHRGIEDAGGEIKFNFITPLKRSEMKLEPLAEKLQDGSTDAVFVSFCGDMLQDYFEAAASANIFANYHLYGSAFTGDEYWLAKCPFPGVEVSVNIPWGIQLPTPANTHFKKVLAENKTNCNLFSLLGWEAGIVASQISSVADMVKSLEGFVFESPRGKVLLDALTHQCYAPVYTGIVRKDETSGNCLLDIGPESPYTEQQRKLLERDINDLAGPTTSWHNVYGCLES